MSAINSCSSAKHILAYKRSRLADSGHCNILLTPLWYTFLPPFAGELATAAGAFDVINFCNNAWAWSATYSQRLSLLASAQVCMTGHVMLQAYKHVQPVVFYC
jgi:hypothetical protein